jgi:hypothetical protein
MKRAVVIALALLSACGSDKKEEDAGPIHPRFEECTASDQSFVRNAHLAVLGRRPRGQAEVDLYVDLLAAAREQAERLPPGDKAAERFLIQVLAQDPAFVERWAEHFMDALRVHRIDVQSQRSCYGRPLRKQADPFLAAWVRDNVSQGPGDGSGDFNMADLLRSSLLLDDLSPLYRGHLFALVNAPIPAANVDRVEAELARRADFGVTFDATYLNRDLVCLGCHTSRESITQHTNPAKNRHWPLRGDFETALWGHPMGVDVERAHAPFRYDGFVFDGFNPAKPEMSPWEWVDSCGRFQTTGIEADPAGVDGFFANLRGDKVSVFDLEKALARGVAIITEHGFTVAEDGSIADPDAAFAYLVAAKIVEGVWIEVVGSPLTISNYFPRNVASRDVLQQLTDNFVANRFSLQTLLADIVVSPYMNRLDPSAGCGEGPYNMPAVYDPWTRADSDKERQNNGPADGVAALSSRTILSASYGALEWLRPYFLSFPERGFGIDFCLQQFSCEELKEQCIAKNECCLAFDFQCVNAPSALEPTADELRAFQRGVGVFLNGGDPGFRGLDFQARLVFEDFVGACTKRQDEVDFIDRLVLLAHQKGGTVEDSIVALKDRLVGIPTLSANEATGRSERAILEDLFQLALDEKAIDVPVEELDQKLRAFCGVLLSSPQFLLSGFAAPDAETVPLLTPVDATYASRCRALADLSPQKTGAVIDCSQSSVSISLR